MIRRFCPRGLCPEGAYVLMELCMEGVLSKGVLSRGVFLSWIRTQCTWVTAATYKFNGVSLSKQCSMQTFLRNKPLNN